MDLGRGAGSRAVAACAVPTGNTRQGVLLGHQQLLGAIIERLAGSTYDQVLGERILYPLGLERTWLFTPATVDRYDDVAPMLYGTTPLRIPRAMASFGPDGGLVSTAAEQVAFLRAFMSGELFPSGYLEEMTRSWRPVFLSP